MSIIDDCVQFLEDLIVGDFNEQQMMSAQIIGGLISLIPVMDQVMDVRDVSGSLYRINKHGGFAKATLDQKIDFGFAAFGVVPEVGSAFKTVFKPLYKQRKAAKGVINGGVAMIERMLGHKKGGAVRWVKALDWAGNTQAAIIQANLALDSCIAMLTYLGQSHWWCPDHLEQLARDVTPGLKSMRGKLEAPIREAAGEIRKFLEEMLGEHAAAVALAVANNAAVMRTIHSPVGGQRSRARHGTTAGAPAHERVGGRARTQGKTAEAKITTSVQQRLWDGFEVLESAAKGLLGEHIVEHHVIEHKNWGLEWNRHDMMGPAGQGKVEGWQSQYKKVNDNGIPIYLCVPSKKILEPGIDSLWFTNRGKPHQYAVVEAKTSKSPHAFLHKMLGEAQGGAGRTKVKQLNTRSRPRSSQRSQNAPQEKDEAKSKNMVMQMSHPWIEKRIIENFRNLRSKILGNYSRHVFLVTPLQIGEHMEILGKILAESLVDKPIQAQKYASLHSAHNVQKEFGEKDLDEAQKKYTAEGRAFR